MVYEQNKNTNGTKSQVVTRLKPSCPQRRGRERRLATRIHRQATSPSRSRRIFQAKSKPKKTSTLYLSIRSLHIVNQEDKVFGTFLQKSQRPFSAFRQSTPNPLKDCVGTRCGKSEAPLGVAQRGF
jgi:hypothetical protein